MNRQRLLNRVAVITGAGRGIGKATALKMVDEGASVALLDIAAEVEAFSEELRPKKAKSMAVVVDIRHQEAVEDAMGQIRERFGRIDILVNNAGVVHPAPLEKVVAEDWDAVVAVNLKGTFFCTQAVLPAMKAQRYGKIVMVGSRVSLGKMDRTVYAATKAGLIGVTRTWALELASHNINVNYVGPGPIATELFDLVNPKESERTKAIIDAIPLRRMGTPENVADLISFLASDEASFITGQTVFICGGITVGLAHY